MKASEKKKKHNSLTRYNLHGNKPKILFGRVIHLSLSYFVEVYLIAYDLFISDFELIFINYSD